MLHFLYSRNQRHIKIHNLGSSLDSDVLYDIVINIIKNITYEKQPTVYLALSGPLTKHYESISNMSSLVYTKKLFFPHVSSESLNYYFTSIIDLIYHEGKKSNFINLMELYDIFSLALYKITIQTE